MSVTEIVSDCQEIGTGALLIINNLILGLGWILTITSLKFIEKFVNMFE